MEPSEVAEYLAVLPERATEFHVTRPDGWHMSIKLGPPVRATAASDEDEAEPEPEEKLPPGAYDPIAARKRAK